jgi:hypothetical protein
MENNVSNIKLHYFYKISPKQKSSLFDSLKTPLDFVSVPYQEGAFSHEAC